MNLDYEDHEIYNELIVIGGLVSFIIGVFMPILYPELHNYNIDWLVVLVMILLVCGGCIDILGYIIIRGNIRMGRIISIIGAIVGCGNIIVIRALIWGRQYKPRNEARERPAAPFGLCPNCGMPLRETLLVDETTNQRKRRCDACDIFV